VDSGAIAQIDDAPNPFELSANYQSLLQHADDEKLQNFTTDGNAGVAMQAAWERVRRSFGTSENSSNRSIRPEEKQLEQFFGVVKEKAKMPIPVWWERSVREAVATDSKDFVFPVSAHRSYRKTSLELYVADGVAVENRGQQFLIETEGDKVTLPSSSIDDRCIEPSLCVLVTPQVVYLATHSGVRYPFSLKSIDRKAGDIIEFPIWTGPVVFQSGIVVSGERLGDHVVSIGLTSDGIIVWGGESHSVYLESFSAAAKVNFRFSSSY